MEGGEHFSLPFLDDPAWRQASARPRWARPESLLFCVQNKPIALDTILPLAFELRAENPALPMEFLFLKRGDMGSIRQNYVLWEGMRRCGAITYLAEGVSGRRNGLSDKAKSLWRLARRLHRMRRQRTLVFYPGDINGHPIRLLADAARGGGGGVVTYPAMAFPASDALIWHMSTRRGVRESDDDYRARQFSSGHSLRPFLAQGDLHLLFNPGQARLESQYTATPFVTVGSPRSFPHWLAFLDEILRRDGVRAADGRPLSDGKRTVVIFYPGDQDLSDLAHATACRDQFRAILRAIQAKAPDFRVLIKPHVICGPDELAREAAAFSSLDIVVTHAHPQLLARISEACLMANGSNIMNDMYTMGTPLIDASLNAPDIVARGGCFYPNPGRVAATGQDEIERALEALVQNPDSLPRADCSRLVAAKPAALSPLLWKSEQ